MPQDDDAHSIDEAFNRICLAGRVPLDMPEVAVRAVKSAFFAGVVATFAMSTRTFTVPPDPAVLDRLLTEATEHIADPARSLSEVAPRDSLLYELRRFIQPDEPEIVAKMRTNFFYGGAVSMIELITGADDRTDLFNEMMSFIRQAAGTDPSR